MTGYIITPESSISSNWMDFILIYALSFSIAHRLNLCMGFHPLASPAIIHFTLIIMIGILWPKEGVMCQSKKKEKLTISIRVQVQKLLNYKLIYLFTCSLFMFFFFLIQICHRFWKIFFRFCQS